MLSAPARECIVAVLAAWLAHPIRFWGYKIDALAQCRNLCIDT